MPLPRLEYRWRVTEIRQGLQDTYVTFVLAGAREGATTATAVRCGDTVNVDGIEGSVHLTPQTGSQVEIRSGTLSGLRSSFNVRHISRDSVRISTPRSVLDVPLGGEFFLLQEFDSRLVGEPLLEGPSGTPKAENRESLSRIEQAVEQILAKLDAVLKSSRKSGR